MPHRFDLMLRVNQREGEELHGDIPDEEWDALLLYVERYERLAATRLAAGSQIRFTLTFDAALGVSATGTLPPADDVDAFVHRMRPFVLKREPTSFYTICNIVARRIAHPAVLALVRRQTDVFSCREFQEQMRLSSDGTVLNAEDNLMQWLNAVGEYHSDPCKEQALREIHEPLALDTMRPFFVSMMMDKAKAVSAIAEIVKLVVKRGEKGREVRFGELRLPKPPSVSPADVPGVGEVNERDAN